MPEKEQTIQSYQQVHDELTNKNIQLIAVSKMKSPEKIMPVYDQGHRDFGENRVQELLEKQEKLPGDIRWHLIGHLQRNKVKKVVPFVHLIHSLDSFRLLKKINKEGKKIERTIPCLLQIKIAREESKYGWDQENLLQLLKKHNDFSEYSYVDIRGLMGMATFTDDEEQLLEEFQSLKNLFDQLKKSHFANAPQFKELSMGMSGDYKLAIKAGATMVRIGSLIFGER